MGLCFEAETYDRHRAQLMNSMPETNTPLGLLVHSGHGPKVQHEPFIL